MNGLYQDANNRPSFDIKFGGGVIKVSTDDTVIPAGWEVTINQQHQQVGNYFYRYSGTNVCRYALKGFSNSKCTSLTPTGNIINSNGLVKSF